MTPTAVGILSVVSRTSGQNKRCYEKLPDRKETVKNYDTTRFFLNNLKKAFCPNLKSVFRNS
jgi:hypothetical protein